MGITPIRYQGIISARRRDGFTTTASTAAAAAAAAATTTRGILDDEEWIRDFEVMCLGFHYILGGFRVATSAGRRRRRSFGFRSSGGSCSSSINSCREEQ